MIRVKHVIWMGLLLVAALALAACGGGRVSGGAGGETGGEETSAETGGEAQVTAAATLAAGGVQGVFYIGKVLPPQVGTAAFYVHYDNQVDLLVVVEGDLGRSMILPGTLEGQSVAASAEAGKSKAAGRVTSKGFEFTLTIPGKGFMRASVEPAEGGGMYIGKLGDFTALLAVLPDGTTTGLAVVEGGDPPVLELLCVDETIDPASLPDTVTATTCDSGQEVELTHDID